MDFAVFRQVLPSSEVGHTLCRFSRTFLQKSLLPVGETESSCADLVVAEELVQRNCSLAESHIGLMPGFAHWPAAAMESAVISKGRTCRWNFIESLQGGSAGVRPTDLQGARSQYDSMSRMLRNELIGVVSSNTNRTGSRLQPWRSCCMESKRGQTFGKNLYALQFASAHRHQAQSLLPDLRKGSLDISTLHEPDVSTLRLQTDYT
jgi:hypothetical protein